MREGERAGIRFLRVLQARRRAQSRSEQMDVIFVDCGALIAQNVDL